MGLGFGVLSGTVFPLHVPYAKKGAGRFSLAPEEQLCFGRVDPPGLGEASPKLCVTGNHLQGVEVGPRGGLQAVVPLPPGDPSSGDRTLSLRPCALHPGGRPCRPPRRSLSAGSSPRGRGLSPPPRPFRGTPSLFGLLPPGEEVWPFHFIRCAFFALFLQPALT